MRRYALTSCTLLLAAAGLSAQTFTTQPCKDSDESSHWYNGGSSSACEVRSATLPLSNDSLKVHGMNGSIEVTGEDRQDIALEHRNWSVSYRLRVPHVLAAKLETTNGSLSLSAIEGHIQGETTNGSLKLANLGGDVHVSTTNGSIKADLAGATWQGTGLSASTTNGAVAVSLPQPYSAHIVASTVNGGISGPNGQVTGRHKELDTTVGSGGPTLTFETTNGGVSIR
jgi:DUF4097 and DUF4098 domain-containing protein YvlB